MHTSPFPGFDPYVQRFWRDAHARMISYAGEVLHAHLPRELRARIEERLIVESPLYDIERRAILPDLYVLERAAHAPWTTSVREDGEGGVAVAEPMVFRIRSEPLRERFIEIREPGADGRVITVIEFLNPANKAPGKGMETYLEKQEEYGAAEISLVEIDLIRGGRHVLTLPESCVPPDKAHWPRVCVRLGWDDEEYRFYPISLRTRLPVIEVPLRKTDAPAPLDLQAIFARCYEMGDYGLDIDYRAEPEPAFSSDESAWADALLREKKLRA